ncbi:hypothetical protein MRX96_008069 [Rhipicephalus microplus]
MDSTEKEVQRPPPVLAGVSATAVACADGWVPCGAVRLLAVCAWSYCEATGFFVQHCASSLASTECQESSKKQGATVASTGPSHSTDRPAGFFG